MDHLLASSNGRVANSNSGPFLWLTWYTHIHADKSNIFVSPYTNIPYIRVYDYNDIITHITNARI